MHNLISIRNQAGEISDLKQGVRKCYTGIKFLFKKGYRCGYSRGGCSRSTYLHLTERINSFPRLVADLAFSFCTSASDSSLRCSTTEPKRLYGEPVRLRSPHDTRPACCPDQQR